MFIYVHFLINIKFISIYFTKLLTIDVSYCRTFCVSNYYNIIFIELSFSTKSKVYMYDVVKQMFIVILVNSYMNQTVLGTIHNNNVFNIHTTSNIFLYWQEHSKYLRNSWQSLYKWKLILCLNKLVLIFEVQIDVIFSYNKLISIFNHIIIRIIICIIGFG